MKPQVCFMLNKFVVTKYSAIVPLLTDTPIVTDNYIVPYQFFFKMTDPISLK